MATIIKGIMSGLTATFALAVIATSASAAFSPGNLGAHSNQVVQESQVLDFSPVLQKAAWSAEDQRSFWEQQEERD